MIFSIFITAVNLMNVFLTLKRNSLPINGHFPFPPNPSNPWQPQSTFCLSKLNLFETFHRIIQNMVFCDWILLHSIMFSGFIHVEACVSSSFLYNELYSFIILFILNNIHSTEVPPFVYPLICRWIFGLLMLFWLLYMNNVTMNIHLLVFVWTYIFISLEYIPKSGIAVSYDTLRNLQVLLQKDCIILHSHRQRMRVPVSAHLCQHLFFICLFLLRTILASVK